MAAQRFVSKVDHWIRALLIGAIVFDLVIMFLLAMRPADPVTTTVTIVLLAIAIALFVSLLLRTHYTVDKGVLRIVCGPFRWTISIDQIGSVTQTRSPLSSPALSLDRLLIRYGKRRRIMVSPVDKHGFLRAIGHDGE